MKTVLLFMLVTLVAIKLFAPGGCLNRKSLEDVKVIHIQPLGKVRKSHLKTVKTSIRLLRLLGLGDGRDEQKSQKEWKPIFFFGIHICTVFL